MAHEIPKSAKQISGVDNKRLIVFVQPADYRLDKLYPIFQVVTPVIWGVTSYQINRDLDEKQTGQLVDWVENCRVIYTCRPEWTDPAYRRNHPWVGSWGFSDLDNIFARNARDKRLLHPPEEGLRLAEAIWEYDCRLGITHYGISLSQKVVGYSRKYPNRVPRSTREKIIRRGGLSRQEEDRVIVVEFLRDVINTYIAALLSGCDAILMPHPHGFMQQVISETLQHPVMRQRFEYQEEPFLLLPQEVYATVMSIVRRILDSHERAKVVKSELEICAEFLYKYAFCYPFSMNIFDDIETVNQINDSKNLRRHLVTVAELVLIAIYAATCPEYSQLLLPFLGELYQLINDPLRLIKNITQLFMDAKQIRDIRMRLPQTIPFAKLVQVYRSVPKSNSNVSDTQPALFIKQRR